MPLPKSLQRAEKTLRKLALGYPEATEDFPWGHRALKVKGKMFLILADDDGVLCATVKLPTSNETALALPFAEPTGYGMGNKGWVTFRFGLEAEVPFELLRGWLEESYRTIAPKRLSATLPAKGEDPTALKPAKKSRSNRSASSASKSRN